MEETIEKKSVGAPKNNCNRLGYRKQYDAELVNQIFKLRKYNLTLTQIAEVVELSKPTICRILRRKHNV